MRSRRIVFHGGRFKRRFESGGSCGAWLAVMSGHPPVSGSRGPLSVWASKRPDQIVLPFSFGTLLPRPPASRGRTRRRGEKTMMPLGALR